MAFSGGMAGVETKRPSKVGFGHKASSSLPTHHAGVMRRAAVPVAASRGPNRIHRNKCGIPAESGCRQAAGPSLPIPLPLLSGSTKRERERERERDGERERDRERETERGREQRVGERERDREMTEKVGETKKAPSVGATWFGESISFR